MRSGFYLILSIPFFVVSYILFVCKYESFLNDYKKCREALLNAISDRSSCDFSNISRILILAEDHRNQYHYGVDFIGIVRSLKIKFLTGRSQGASTIEQQFIRAITKRKERNLRRKIREQLLAVFVRAKFSREDINYAYLCNAYYGEKNIGKIGVLDLWGKGCSDYEIVSYIKFPVPSKKSLTHDGKIKRRVDHISKIELKKLGLIWL
nr:transglycosylase domain-containing protein [Alcaligenes faecalis]